MNIGQLVWKGVLFLNSITGSEKVQRRNRFRMGQAAMKLMNFLNIDVSSRVVENPFVLDSLERKKMKVLDVGCCDSFFIYELMARGYDTYGTDFNVYLREEDIKFTKADITKDIPLQKNFFDRITAISVIEHIGLGQYKDPLVNDGDVVAMRNLSKLLKKGGKLLLTVPISGDYAVIKRKKRKYDELRLKKITRGFKIEKEKYFVISRFRKNSGILGNRWTEISKREAFTIKDVSDSDNMVACIILRRDA